MHVPAPHTITMHTVPQLRHHGSCNYGVRVCLLALQAYHKREVYAASQCSHALDMVREGMYAPGQTLLRAKNLSSR